MDMIRPDELSGFQPEKIGPNTIRLYPGFVANSSSNPQAGIRSTATIDINLTTTGANGLDTGTATAGVDYAIYVFQDANGNVCAVASHATALGGVVVPAGFSLALSAKLPFGFCYMPNGIGVPDFSLSHWPLPRIDFDGLDESTLFNCGWRNSAEQLVGQVADAQSTNSLFDWFDASALMPDASRYAILHCRLKSLTGAGKLNLQVPGNNTIHQQVLSVQTPGEEQNIRLQIRTSSLRWGLWQTTTTAVAATIKVAGYSMTEY